MEKNILEKIQKSVLRFLVPLSTEETYKIIVEEAVKLIGGHYGSILLLQNGELTRVYSSSKVLYDVASGKKGPLGNRDPRYQVVDRKKAMVLTANQMRELKKKFPGLRSLGERAAIMIPLSYRSRSIGILSVTALENSDFSKEELDILTLFGSLASMAIRKTQLYNETKLALETRDFFISMASHELRTPLTSINGYTHLLYNKFAKKNTQESRWVEGLSAECLRMTILIKELLEINRIRSGELNYYLKECYLREVVDRAIANFKFVHPERKIVFVDKLGKSKGIVIADFDKTLQVINNLLDNAAKFSEVDKEINLTLRRRNSFFEICIRDQGKGINKKDLPKIFNSFYRGSTEKEGMGLGLFIAKDIVDRLHGSIKVTSKINKGTEFEISLPKYSSRANLKFSP